MYSPITQSKNVSVEKTIAAGWIIAEYKRIFDIDITGLVGSCREITLCRCNDSGFRFYYPFDIVGDSSFYHQLQVNDWYYMPTKWEFKESIGHITGNAVLEIGSGRGDFLRMMRHAFPDVTLVGLELNREAVEEAQNRGFRVLVESSADHAKHNKEQYDIVACFQVLEHIPSPMHLLADAIEMLKPGGKLILSVPDNSKRPYASIFVNTDNILNMPPHHQGLWDILSLAFLPSVLPLRLEYIAVEPATSSHHSNSYRGLMKRDLMRRFGRFFGIGIYAMGRPFYDHALKHLNRYLPAHSVFALFKKTAP